MTSDRALSIVFMASNLSVLPLWGLMWLAPRTAVTRRVLGSPWVCVPFAALYAVLLVSKLGGVAAAARTPSLAGVAAVMGTPGGASLAWAHYLASDLYIGRWMYFDGIEREAPRSFMTVVLLLAFAFGPLGLLVHLVFRPQTARSVAGEPDEGTSWGPAGRTALHAPGLRDLRLDCEAPAVNPSSER